MFLAFGFRGNFSCFIRAKGRRIRSTQNISVLNYSEKGNVQKHNGIINMDVVSDNAKGCGVEFG